MVTRHGRMLSGNGGSVGGRQPQGLDSRLFVQAHFIDGTVGIRRSRVQEHAFRKRSEELLSMCGGRTRFLEGVRVVVVDDSPDIRKSMGTLLALWGAEVRSCATSGEAEALLGEGGPPDLLIADLRLEDGKSGAEMALRLRRVFGPFPVVIITGETSPRCSSEIPNPDFVLLKKPIPERLLQEEIGKILARSRKP